MERGEEREREGGGEMEWKERGKERERGGEREWKERGKEKEKEKSEGGERKEVGEVWREREARERINYCYEFVLCTRKQYH